MGFPANKGKLLRHSPVLSEFEHTESFMKLQSKLITPGWGPQFLHNTSTGWIWARCVSSPTVGVPSLPNRYVMDRIGQDWSLAWEILLVEIVNDRRRTYLADWLYYNLTLWDYGSCELNETPHDKTVRSAKTKITLGIRPVWTESSLSAWRKLESLATHWTYSEDSDKTGRMPRLIWVFAGRTDHFVGFVTKRLKYWCWIKTSQVTRNAFIAFPHRLL